MGGILAIEAVLSLRHEVAAYRLAIVQDQDLIGRVFGPTVRLLYAEGHQAEARAMVTALDEREPEIKVRWIHFGPEAVPGDRPLVHLDSDHLPMVGRPTTRFATLPDGEERVLTWIYLGQDEQGIAAMEISETLVQHRQHVLRTVGQTLSSFLLTMILATGALLWLERRYIVRPVDQILAYARGELAAAPVDAGELRAVAQALSGLVLKADQEQAARHAAEAQLRHADRLGTVGALAASVAHELGSPLNVVRIHAQEVASGAYGSDPELVGDGHQIVGQCDRMIGLLKRLMELARAQVSDPEEVDLGALVQGTMTLVRTLARKAGVQVVYPAPEVPVRVRGVRTELQQVALNLVTNAIQAMPEGGTLTVEVRQDAGEAILRVRDTGVGIPLEDHARVFEAFYTTKPEGRGTGLGLSVVAGIVRDHGGRVAVESAPGQGSCFTVGLPLVARPERLAQNVLGPWGAEVPVPPPHPPVLLIAEDDDALRALLARAFLREGYAVHEAGDGQQILALTGDGLRPDLVVSDVHMPRLSGPAALRRLRDAGLHCPAIFITAFGVTDAQPEIAALGGCTLLEKPVDLAELKALVRERLTEGV